MGGNAAKERRRAERQKNVDHIVTTDSKEASKSKSMPKDKMIRKKAENKIPVGRKSNHSSKVKPKVGVGKTRVQKGAQGKINTTSTSTNKIKKPKHLSRKMKLTNDPNEMEQLLKKEEEFKTKKSERAERFKAKVIEAVGGPEYFDEEAYTALMNNGGGKIESIIKAVKISTDDVKDDEEDGQGQTSQSLLLHSHEKELPEVAAAEQPVFTNDYDASVHQTTELPPKPCSSDCSSSEASDSEMEVEDNAKNKRTRGRKHRGRKEGTAIDTVVREELKDTSTKNSSETVKEDEETTLEAESSRNIQSQDRRRCIGRKPLTDFKVGNKYTGTIRYVKPNLGLFIDIGCHYDAFCHISRASDDFVENLDAMFKIGDELSNKVRIVEIDRSKKRITVSLQSDNRIEDELKSSRDHKERLEAKATKKRKVNPTVLEKVEKVPLLKNKATNTSQATSLSLISSYTSRNTEVPIQVTPSEKSLSELKRERKLQRRAERRKQEELSTESVP